MGGCDVWTNEQPEQDIEVYSPWVCRFGHHKAHTHMCTQLWECSRWRAKSPFLLNIHPLFSLHSPFPSAITPLRTSFPQTFLSPSSLVLSFVTAPATLPVCPKRRGKKESVKDAEELANSNENRRGRGQNHHRGQLWLGLCTCVFMCGSFLGLIVPEMLKTVLEATMCP